MSSSETKSGVGDADITLKKSDDEKEAPRDKLSVTGTMKEIKEVEQMERSTVLLTVGFGYGGCPATVTISEMGSKAAGVAAGIINKTKVSCTNQIRPYTALVSTGEDRASSRTWRSG